MKKILALAMVACLIATAALADELKVTVNVENGETPTKVVGADIYAMMGDRLTEITVTPDDNVPFKMNMKAGALRLKAGYLTRAQLNGKDEKEEK